MPTKFFCQNCGALSFTEDEDKCFKCGKSKSFSQNLQRLKGENFLAIDSDNIQNLNKYTKIIITEQLQPLLNGKSLKHVEGIELCESFLLVSPYCQISCDFEFDFDYEASDTEEVAYTVHEERNYDALALNFRPDYTVPRTKYKTVERNKRNIESSASGSATSTLLSSNQIVDIKTKLPDNHKEVSSIQDLLEGKADFASKEIESKELIKFDNLGGYIKSLQKSLTGSSECRVRMLVQEHVFELVKEAFESDKSLRNQMFKTAKETSARGDRNRNYSIYNKELEFRQENIMLDFILIQIYSGTDSSKYIFSISPSQYRKSWVNTSALGRFLPAKRLLSNFTGQNTLIQPKSSRSEIKWLRKNYLLPLAVFYACYLINAIIKSIILLLPEDVLSSLSSGIDVESCGSYGLIFFLYWGWMVYQERKTHNNEIRKIINKKIEIVDNCSEELINSDAFSLKIESGADHNIKHEDLVFSIGSRRISVKKVLLILAIVIPVIDLLVNCLF